MSKRYSGKSFKDSSVMKKPKLSLKEKRKIKREKKRKWYRVITKNLVINEIIRFALALSQKKL